MSSCKSPPHPLLYIIYKNSVVCHSGELFCVTLCYSAQWTKVNAIVMKKEKLMEQMRPANDTANDMDTDSSHVATNNDDDDDDIDLADALDWRSKMV